MNVFLATNYGDVTAVQFATFFAVLVLLMGALLLGTNLKDKWWPKAKSAEEMIISPSPLPVKKISDVATKDDLKILINDIDDLKRQINDQRNISRNALGKIHSRMDGLAKQSDTMSGEMKGELAGIKTVLEKLLAKAMT